MVTPQEHLLQGDTGRGRAFSYHRTFSSFIRLLVRLTDIEVERSYIGTMVGRLRLFIVAEYHNRFHRIRSPLCFRVFNTAFVPFVILSSPRLEDRFSLWLESRGNLRAV